MRKSLIAAVALLLTISQLSVTVAGHGFQYTDAAHRTRLRWTSRTITLFLSKSLLQPQSNIKSGSDVAGAVQRSIEHWSEAADIQFVQRWTGDESLSAAGSNGDGKSLITVAATDENLAPFMSAHSDMPARTRVFFNKIGAISEADVVLNPYEQFSSDGTPGTFDLESTFTHELGHLLGLDHSSLMSATMQPRQGKNGVLRPSRSRLMPTSTS